MALRLKLNILVDNQPTNKDVQRSLHIFAEPLKLQAETERMKGTNNAKVKQIEEWLRSLEEEVIKLILEEMWEGLLTTLYNISLSVYRIR